MIKAAKKYATTLWRIRFQDRSTLIKASDNIWDSQRVITKCCFNYYLKYHHAGRISNDTKKRWEQ